MPRVRHGGRSLQFQASRSTQRPRVGSEQQTVHLLPLQKKKKTQTIMTRPASTGRGRSGSAHSNPPTPAATLRTVAAAAAMAQGLLLADEVREGPVE